MAIRRKNDRAVVVAPPAGRSHGRIADVAPAAMGRAEPGDPAERLAVALIERELARVLKDGVRYQNANRRLVGIRRALLGRPEGRVEIERITTAVWANAGSAVRTAAKAHVDVRPYAVESAMHFVRWQREHDVRSSTALALLGAAATWTGLASVLRDRAFAQDPVGYGVQAAKSDGQGASVHRSADAVLKAAVAADAAARLNLLSALDLEQRSRAERPHQIDPEVQRRMIAIVEARQRQRAEAAALPAAGEEPDPPEPASMAVQEPPEPGFRSGSVVEDEWSQTEESPMNPETMAAHEAALSQQRDNAVGRGQRLQRLADDAQAALDRAREQGVEPEELERLTNEAARARHAAAQARPPAARPPAAPPPAIGGGGTHLTPAKAGEIRAAALAAQAANRARARGI